MAPFFSKVALGAALCVAGVAAQADSCGSAHTDETSCNADASTGGGCTWCKCSAVPSACYTKADAAKLPGGVFACDSAAALRGSPAGARPGAGAILDKWMTLAKLHPEPFAQSLKNSFNFPEAKFAKADAGDAEKMANSAPTATKLPTVFAHGMGDSCFNDGMKEITADTGKVSLGWICFCCHILISSICFASHLFCIACFASPWFF